MKKKLTSVLMSSILLGQPVALAEKQTSNTVAQAKPVVEQNQTTSTEKTKLQMLKDELFTKENLLIGAGCFVGAFALTWMLLPSGNADQNSGTVYDPVPPAAFYKAFQEAITDSERGQQLREAIAKCARTPKAIVIDEYREAILCLDRAIKNECGADELQSKFKAIGFQSVPNNLKTNLISAIEFLTQNCMSNADKVGGIYQQLICNALNYPENQQDLENKVAKAVTIWTNSLLPQQQKEELRQYLSQSIKRVSSYFNSQNSHELIGIEKEQREKCRKALSEWKEAVEKYRAATIFNKSEPKRKMDDASQKADKAIAELKATILKLDEFGYKNQEAMDAIINCERLKKHFVENISSRTASAETILPISSFLSKKSPVFKMPEAKEKQ